LKVISTQWRNRMLFQEELKYKQDLVEARLKDLVEIKDTPAIIVEAMKYSLLAGGKRLRPILTEVVCTALGGNSTEVMNLGCAIEMIHTYSLIHDDLPAMDNDSLRRGKPTNHIVYGEAMAILAGDSLLNYAFEVVFRECITSGFDTRFIKAGEIIATASGATGMIGGQVIDIENEGKVIEISDLYKMHRKKTGAIIEAACLTGCVVSGNIKYYDIVKEYSQNLGIAFQIIDDILDYTGDEKKLGKNIGSDKENNKATFVSLLGIQKSRALAEHYSSDAKKLAEEIDGDGFLVELTEYLLHRES
jgi:geranylgeranyl diphosphate synthase type II